MSATVPHRRPSLDTGGILSGLPVSAFDWQALAGLANFANGHGAALIPWTFIGYQVAKGTSATFHFYVAPKARAVERVWCVNLRCDIPGATAVVTAGSASVTAAPLSTRTGRTASLVIREPLASKTALPGDAALMVVADPDSDVVVESVAMYEQTRSVLDLDSTDYGVDLGTVAVRQPIAAFANASLAGVADAVKNLDARRAGLFHWSAPDADPLTFTSGSYAPMFDLDPLILGAVNAVGSTTADVTVAAYAKVNSGTGQVRFTSASTSDATTLSITGTSFGWVTGTLSVDAEDLTAADGRRASGWDSVKIECNDNTAATLSVAAVSIVRTTAPV